MAQALYAVAGATGYIGNKLTRELLDRGKAVRALARTPEKAEDLAEAGAEVVRADMLTPAGLPPALDGVTVAYYLVHSMGRGAGDSDFATRDKESAANFAVAARDAGVEQIVYLGGLGNPRSKHLRSRHETAEKLMESGIPVTYLRAAAVIGAGSESFRTVLYLVKRLPVMVTPRWVDTKTQPIGIDDVIRYLAEAPETEGASGREVQIGGEVTTYGGMMDALAEAIGARRRPKIGVPLLTPWLSSLWIGLVTPVDADVARPLIEGLSTETTVHDPSGMELFGFEPAPLGEAMDAAVNER